MSHVRIVRPGLQTTVQDLGRWGWQARGVPVAGAMDACSHRVANALVGNPPGTATLEVVLMGPQIEFEDDRVIAVAGASFEVTVNGARVPAATAIEVAAGARLLFGARVQGARCYLAISGGIATPPVLGSRATHVVSRMGGLDGRALLAGDRLPLGRRRSDDSGDGRGSVSRPALQPNVLPALAAEGGCARVRVIEGPHMGWFPPTAFSDLQVGEYVISPQSDRMGFRLEGRRIARVRVDDMISSSTPFGALQVPRSGDPILLMADRQTTGGYPILATVISADLGVAAQLSPGDRLSFLACTLDEARVARADQERALQAFEG